MPLPTSMEANSSSFSKITNSSDDINQLLFTSQQRIIHQVAYTQKLIRSQLYLVLLLGVAITIHLIPFLFINRDTKTFAAGIMIIFGFNYNIIFHWIRRKQLIGEAKRFLKSVQDNRRLKQNHIFFYTISGYLEKLYTLLFYNKKHNKLHDSYFSSPPQEIGSEIEEKLMKSLNNDIFILF
jgi:hypothetical protein